MTARVKSNFGKKSELLPDDLSVQLYLQDQSRNGTPIHVMVI